MKELRLLVVDNDFKEYDTPEALDRVSSRFKQERILFRYDSCLQNLADDFLITGKYNVLLVDNDFGEGLKTLQKVRNHKLPIAYISAYTLEGLLSLYERLSRQDGKYMNPLDFDELNIKLIKKREKSIPKDVSAKQLARGIYDFLKMLR